MASLTVGNVHVNVPLSNLAVLYRPDEEGFIADQVCPPLPVQNETDVYYKWTTGPFFATDVDDLVADRSAPRRIEFDATTASYKAERRELAWDISDRERKNADNQLRLEQVKQQGVLARLMLRKEDRVATLLKKTSNGGGLTLGANATQKWDATAGTFTTIATDVQLGITAIRQAIGTAPNTIIIPRGVAEGMIKSGFYTAAAGPLISSADPTASPLYREFPFLPPTLWGMRVLVPGAIKNTAKEGQTASYSDVWGEQVRLLYVTPGPSLDTPSVAYSIRSEALTTRQWRDEERRVDAYSVGYTGVELVVAPASGYEIADCLT